MKGETPDVEVQVESVSFPLASRDLVRDRAGNRHRRGDIFGSRQGEVEEILERLARAGRLRAGQAWATASGDRPPTILADKAAAIVADLKAGIGVVKLAKVHDVGVGTVRKLKAKLAT